ncbi:MAG: hypothetical protein KDI92_01945 [Xanthomonadales bacterium]|nr:hypothetical protein [Xanthomonadales bacterium]
MSLSLRIVGLLGLLLFSGVFALTFGVPEWVEQSAKGFIQNKVTKEVKEIASPVIDSSLAQTAKKLADELGFQESQLKKDLDNQLPEKIASILVSLCGYDCEKKKQLGKDIRDSYQNRISNLKLGQHHLNQLVKSQYLEITDNLKADLRIFTFSNALMFTFLLLTSLLKSQSIKHLYVPGVLLLLATIISIVLYLFGQDWFYTIVYNDYMGWTYLVYLGLIFGLLMDIAFNKGRVTTEVFNFIGHTFSSIGSISPC